MQTLCFGKVVVLIETVLSLGFLSHGVFVGTCGRCTGCKVSKEEAELGYNASLTDQTTVTAQVYKAVAVIHWWSCLVSLRALHLSIGQTPALLE